MRSVDPGTSHMAMQQSGKTILVFSPRRNPSHDSRLLKLCAYLASCHCTVRLMWLQRQVDETPALPDYVEAVPCVTTHPHFRHERGFFGKLENALDAEWCVTKALTREEPQSLWVSGLVPLVLVMPYLLAHSRVRFVYDAREYVLGQQKCVGRRRKLLRERLMIQAILSVEEWASRQAVAVVHTNRWRRRLFEHSHLAAKTKLVIIENLHCSSMDSGGVAPAPAAATVGYVGGMAGERGLNLLVDALGLLPATHSVTIVGTGTNEERAAIMNHARDVGAAARLNFIAAVPYWELQSICRTFTCGVLLIEDDCLNNRYCSPNKVFDYVAAGCPLVVTGVPPLTELTRSLGIGIAVSQPVDAKSVAAAIRSVIENRAVFHSRCTEAADTLDWSTQRGTIDSIVAMFYP